MNARFPFRRSIVALGFALTVVFLGPFFRIGAYEVETHAALSELAAREHPDCRLESFLRDSLGLSGGLDTITAGGTYLHWIRQGSIDEDSDVVFRYALHFYNPINKQGLSDLALLPAGRSFRNSLDWAWGDQGDFNGNYSWRAARAALFDWLTSAVPGIAQNDEQRVFLCLGHLVHLVQDLAQPQHTRNDAHVGRSHGGEDAVYEHFCRDHYRTTDQIRNALPQWAAERVPLFRRLPPRSALQGRPPEFVAFWDTYQYFGTQDPSLGFAGTLGLAEFSNAFFVTDNTMFTGEPVDWTKTKTLAPVGTQFLRNPGCGRTWQFFDPEAVSDEHRFPYPRLDGLVGLCDVLAPQGRRYRVAEISRAGQDAVDSPEYRLLSLRSPAPEGCCVARVAAVDPENPASERVTLRLGLNNDVWPHHAAALLPKAIAYSTGLINYFVRGKLKCRVIVADCPEDRRALVEITNLSEWQGEGETLLDGTFHLISDDFLGLLRTEAATIDRSSGYPGSLARGSRFRVNFPDLTLGEHPLLVFQGTVGNETGIAVAATVVEVVRESELGPPVPSRRTAVTFLSGQMAGEQAEAELELTDDLGFKLADRPVRFSVSLNGRGGPEVANQNTDCHGRIRVSASRTLDNGDLAKTVRIAAYFEGATGYQPSNSRIEITED